VVSHDEAPTLHNAFGQVADAAAPGDPVWLLDSGSTDGSPDVARALGADEVILAPLGKGHAMTVALERCETTHVCFVDGDLFGSTRNIPLTLREGLAEGEPDMVVAEFSWPGKRLWSATAGLYNPLVGALFPEAVGHVGRTDFSGLRILRRDLGVRLPPGYGVETFLNIHSALRGWDTRVVDIGDYDGVVRENPALARDVAETILDVAVAEGRLDPERRAEWELWAAVVREVLRTASDVDTDDDAAVLDYTSRLISAIERPLPPAS